MVVVTCVGLLFFHMLHLLIFVPYSGRGPVACVPSVCSRHPAWTVVGEGLAVRLGAPVWLHSDCLLGNFPGRKTTKTPALAGVLSLALAYHVILGLCQVVGHICQLDAASPSHFAAARQPGQSG